MSSRWAVKSGWETSLSVPTQLSKFFSHLGVQRKGSSSWTCCHKHRRTGNFLPEGAVTICPKNYRKLPKFLRNSRLRKETRAILCKNIGHTYTGIWRWLDTVFQGQYLPGLSVNYVAINKHLKKLTPVVLDKDEICHDQGCNDIRVGVVIARKWHHYLRHHLQQYFLAPGTVLTKSFTGAYFLQYGRPVKLKQNL